MNLHFMENFPFGGKTNFEEQITNNQKIHTIRADKEDIWKEGEIIHFVKGNNPEEYSCYMVGVCTSIQKIEIDYNGQLEIYVDNKKLESNEVQNVSRCDGFESVSTFEKWFIPIIEKEGKFTGKLIHWTDFSY